MGNWIKSSFTTLCGTATTPYIQDFSTSNQNNNTFNCWSEGNGGNSSTGPAHPFSNSSWKEDDFANQSSGSRSARIRIEGVALNDEWLISDEIYLDPLYDILDFSIALTQNGSTNSSNLGSDDFVAFLITTDGGISWQILELWSQATPISNTLQNQTYDLTPYLNMTVQFAFLADDGTVNDGIDVDFFVDDFTIINICNSDIYYPDLDGDGNGDNNSSGNSYCVGTQPPNTVSNNDDCDDNNPNDSVINVDSNPIPFGIYYANDTLNSIGTVIGGSIGVDTVTFQAGKEIILRNGFTVLSGSDWHAFLDEDCPPSSVPLVSNQNSKLVEEKRKTPPSNDFDIQLNIAPNPTQSNTTIEYALGNSTKLNIQIFDINGQLMTTLLQNQLTDAGIYRLDYNTQQLNSGVYYVFISTETSVVSERLVIIK